MTDRNPFHNADENLYSLSTGIVSSKDKDHINCEQAEEVGKAIQHGLENILFHTATIKKRTRSQTWNPCRIQRQQKAKKRWQNQVSCSID